MRLAKLGVIGAVAGAIVVPSAHAAPGKLIARDTDSGLPTAVSTDGRALRSRALLVRITASPNEPVQVSWNTSCAKGAKGRVREGDYTVTGADPVGIDQGFRRPTDCLINVLAGYENGGLAGTIEIEIFARGRFVRRG